MAKKVSSHFQGYTVPAPGLPAEATFQVNIFGARFTVHVPGKRDFDEARAIRFIVETALISEKKELASHLKSHPQSLQGIRDAWRTWSRSREFADYLKGYSTPEEWRDYYEAPDKLS